MKTRDRLRAVDASAPEWHKGVPEFPMEDVTLMRLIRVASLGITSIIDPLLRERGLTESSYHTLIVALASGPKGTTPSTLCEQVGQNRANMTRILDLLAEEQLVRVTVDARDARRRRVIATAVGRKLVRTIAQKFQPILKIVFGALHAADKRSLESTLRTLIESMDDAELMVGQQA